MQPDYDTAQSHDPSLVQDIIERRDNVFDQNNIRDVTLYVAHVTHERSIRSLARQTGRSMKEIQRSVDYVREQLNDELGDHLPR